MPAARRDTRYEPLFELASGGMATVLTARQIAAGGFERVVVLKRVHRHLLRDGSFRDMFRDEARIASLVRHPNVVPVIDVIESDRELVLVMEYVESVSLSTLLKAARERGERLPPAVVVRVAADMLAGLHAAHEAVDLRGERLEVVHRDVSPQNVVVSVDGSSRLIDFGVAKAKSRLVETRSGALKGKYGYMAPEQMRGKPVDRRTDLFAAGVVLWEALTAEPLFAGDTELDTMRRILELTVPRPSTRCPGVPPALDEAVLRALERAPEGRFSTALEMAVAVESSLGAASPREVASWVERLCGARIEERRRALHDALGAGPSSGPGHEPLDEPAHTASLTGVPAALAQAAQPEPELPTASLSPSSLRSPGAPASGPAPAPSPPARPPLPRALLLVALLAAAAVVVAAVSLGASGRKPAAAPAAEAPSSSVASLVIPSGSTSPLPDAPAHAPVASAASAAPSAAPSASARKAPGRPKGELQQNPYGAP